VLYISFSCGVVLSLLSISVIPSFSTLAHPPHRSGPFIPLYYVGPCDISQLSTSSVLRRLLLFGVRRFYHFRRWEFANSGSKNYRLSELHPLLWFFPKIRWLFNDLISFPTDTGINCTRFLRPHGLYDDIWDLYQCRWPLPRKPSHNGFDWIGVTLFIVHGLASFCVPCTYSHNWFPLFLISFRHPLDHLPFDRKSSVSLAISTFGFNRWLCMGYY
jgi:hypothetical protein